MSDLCRYCGYYFCAAEDERLRCNGAKETAALRAELAAVSEARDEACAMLGEYTQGCNEALDDVSAIATSEPVVKQRRAVLAKDSARIAELRDVGRKP